MAGGVHAKVQLTYWVDAIFLSFTELHRLCDWPSRKHYASGLIRILAYLEVPVSVNDGVGSPGRSKRSVRPWTVPHARVALSD